MKQRDNWKTITVIMLPVLLQIAPFVHFKEEMNKFQKTNFVRKRILFKSVSNKGDFNKLI